MILTSTNEGINEKDIHAILEALEILESRCISLENDSTIGNEINQAKKSITNAQISVWNALKAEKKKLYN